MAFLLVGLVCLAVGLPAQGEEIVAQARSVAYDIDGLLPPAAEITNSSTDNSVPGWEKGKLLDVLVRGTRAAHHEPGHVEQHEHSESTGHQHEHQHEHEHQKKGDTKPGETKTRQKRGYCSVCGGQLGGGYQQQRPVYQQPIYAQPSYGGGGGCGGNCGGGGYQQQRPVYQQPIYAQPSYGGGGGGGRYCNTCGGNLGGGGGYGGGGQSFSSSSSQSSASSYGRK